MTFFLFLFVPLQRDYSDDDVVCHSHRGIRGWQTGISGWRLRQAVVEVGHQSDVSGTDSVVSNDGGVA